MKVQSHLVRDLFAREKQKSHGGARSSGPRSHGH